MTKIVRPFKTRFRYAYSYCLKLAMQINSLTHYTRGTLSRLIPLQLFVSIRFQVYFTPLSGFFSPFPHGTSSLSVTKEYLALEGGPPMFKQDFTCPVLLEDLKAFYLYGAITLYCLAFHLVPVFTFKTLGWSAFARHY